LDYFQYQFNLKVLLISYYCYNEEGPNIFLPSNDT